MNTTNWKKNMFVNHESDVPIYLQLTNYFRLQIKSGALKENDKMIPEEEICRILGISRSTVRQAMNQLVDEGLLVRYRGKGTFVSKKAYHRSFDHLYNFTSDMAALGIRPSSATLLQEVTNVKGSLIQTKMELSDGQCEVFHLIRIRMADGKPVMHEDTYMPYFLCPGIENYNFDQNSLYEVLKNHYNIIPYTAIETLQGILIPKNILPHLNCPANTVGYHITRVARLNSNFVYEYTSSITRADMCYYQFALSNSSAAKTNSSIMFEENH